MTTTIDAQFKAYPSGDPAGMTGTFGKPYETVDDDGNRVGVAEHIVAVTGVADEGGDVFVPGVFADAIQHGVKAKGVSGHDWSAKVSKAIEREEWLPRDPRIAQRIIPNLPDGVEWPSAAGAVYVKAEYNLNTPEGQRAYENAKFYGPEESFSVGYKVAPGGARKRGGLRYIAKLAGWYEWSDVLHGMNKYAFGLSVKTGLLDSEMEYSGGRLVDDAEVKEVRRVKDSNYWGLPIGTVIRPGMKPRGPKALKIRKAGEVPDPTVGTTTKEPPSTTGGKTPDEADVDKLDTRSQNERAEDDKLEAAQRDAPAPVDQEAARARAQANREAVRSGARRRPEPPAPTDETPPAADVPTDVQARMDAAKREGRDDEAAKIYAEHLRAKKPDRGTAPADTGVAKNAPDLDVPAGDEPAGMDTEASTSPDEQAPPEPSGDAEFDARVAGSVGDYRRWLDSASDDDLDSDIDALQTRADQMKTNVAERPAYFKFVKGFVEPATAERDRRRKETPEDRAKRDALAKRGEAHRETIRAAAQRRPAPPAPQVSAGVDAEQPSAEDNTPEKPGKAPDVEDAAPDEVLSADDLADGEEIGADALGLVEADDGELEVTPDVADRQDRVEQLLEQGDTAVADLDDEQLASTRRDVADELALQDELARRDRAGKRAEPAAGGGDAADTAAPPPEGAAVAPPDRAEDADPAAAVEAPEKPQTRAGLAGAAEDYADALDAGDEAATVSARGRLKSSLRRSRSESEQAQTLRDMLATDEPPDPAQVRDLATGMRDEAKARRNEQAKTRRLAKRLERERLRSLLGSIDAEMRTRGLPAPTGGPPNAGAGQEEGVLSQEDLAAGEAAVAANGPISDTEPEVDTESDTAAPVVETDTAAGPAAAGEPPFSSVDEVQAHLADQPGMDAVQWDTALLSPGGGLVMVATTSDPPEWVIAHTGSGTVVARDLPDRAGARDAMGALEQAQGPDSQPINWATPDADTLRQNITDAGFTPDTLLAAARGDSGAEVTAGDTGPGETPDAAAPNRQPTGPPENADDAVALLRQAVALNTEAAGRENRTSRERDKLISELMTAGYPANVDDYEQPDGTTMTPDEAVSLLQEAVRLNLEAQGRENRASRERDKLVAELMTAGYPANVDDYLPDAEGSGVDEAGDLGKAPAGPEPGVLVNQVRDASDDELLMLLAEHAEYDAAVESILVEMDRRQRDAELSQAIDEDAQWRRLDELMAAGWDEETAVEEALGVPVEDQRRERAIGMLRSQGYVGTRFEDLARRSYRDYVASAYRAAEDAARGHLLTREAQNANVDPARLFSGPEVRARRWASDELKQWWDENGRLTFTDHKALLLGGQAAHRGAEGAFLT